MLGRLFAEERRLPLAEVRAALGPATLEAFLASGLVALEADSVVGRVHIAPCEDLVLASDRRDLHRQGCAEFVLGAGGVTRRMAALMPRPAGAAVLDLGCGCGVLGLLAARHAGHVTALDVNPRAVAFTRFNAALNGCDNLEALDGDLYAPVAGRRFDLVLCNAPYVVSPDATYLYRDGGSDFCARLARATPAHLAEGGIAVLGLHWAVHEGESWQRTVVGWFAEGGCDLWLLTSQRFAPADYAWLWLTQQHGGEVPEAELERWCAAYRAAGVAELGGGHAILHRPRGRAPWVEVRELPPLGADAGSALERVFRARDLAAGASDDELLARRLRPVDDLDIVEQRVPGPTGWRRHAVDLRARSGLRLALRVDTRAGDLLGWLDGSRTAGAAATAFAVERGLDAAAVRAALPSLLRELLGHGFLV